MTWRRPSRLATAASRLRHPSPRMSAVNLGSGCKRPHPPDRVHRPLRLHEPRRVDLVPFPLVPHIVPRQRCDNRRPQSAPPRSSGLRSTSSSANRQLRSLPSAVRRTRLQLRQKGRRDAEAMMPTRPPPSVYQTPSPVPSGRSPGRRAAGQCLARSVREFRERNRPCRAPS